MGGYAGLEPVGVPVELIRTLLLPNRLAMFRGGLSFLAPIRAGALL